MERDRTTRDTRAFLWDVREAADNIPAFIQGRTENDYSTDALLHSAVECQLEIIGEALNQLDKSAPKTAARIPHLHQIVGLRNILIHGHAVVKDALIWRSVREDLSQLRATVDALLKELGERE
jgi:uncharacterized protein with HEPN domain